MTPRPVHDDIKKYDYHLKYSATRDTWYAAYDAEKGAAWHRWDEEKFNLISRRQLPNDIWISQASKGTTNPRIVTGAGLS